MWHETKSILPKDGEKIIGMDSGGHERKLVFHKNLFWLRDMSMYVYYTPVRWKLGN